MLLCAELAEAEVSRAASKALRKLCEECGAKLAPYLETFMALYQRITSAAQASTSGSGHPSSLEEDSIQQVGFSAPEEPTLPVLCLLSSLDIPAFPESNQHCHAHYRSSV